jgi:hypothetical protein
VEEWLHGDPEKLRAGLQRQADSGEVPTIDKFLAMQEVYGYTPIAGDIGEPRGRRRTRIETYRVLRDTALARRVKRLYDYGCQMCGHSALLLRDTPYAEAHHIKPLGAPHDGPDELRNIICVCPNCHVLLDYGVVRLVVTELKLRLRHEISAEFVNYHNTTILNNVRLHD